VPDAIVDTSSFVVLTPLSALRIMRLPCLTAGPFPFHSRSRSRPKLGGPFLCLCSSERASLLDQLLPAAAALTSGSENSNLRCTPGQGAAVAVFAPLQRTQQGRNESYHEILAGSHVLAAETLQVNSVSFDA
jgi:hypothetical protein